MNTVIVGGKVVMKERTFQTVDVESLYDELRKEASRGISPEQRAFAEKLQKIKPYCQKWYEGWEKIDYKPFHVMNSEVRCSFYLDTHRCWMKYDRNMRK